MNILLINITKGRWHGVSCGMTIAKEVAKRREITMFELLKIR